MRIIPVIKCTLIFTIFLLLSISCVSAAETDAAHDINGTNFMALDENIAESTDNFLELDDDYTFDSTTDSNYADGINIDDDNFVVDGKEHTINANHQARIFNITGKNVTLKNIKFINGYSSADGGVIYSKYGLNLIDCQFINNHASGSGGAVFIENNSLNNEFTSTFINNSAFNGGAIYFAGTYFGNNTINSYFENNSAERAGGAIYLMGDAINNTFISEFYGNNASKASGGGIFFRNLNEGNVFESIFRYNYGYYGAGMFFFNKANNNRFNSDFRFNVAESCGGALFFYDKTNNNDFSGYFMGNAALGKVDEINGNGGAITFKDTSSNSIFSCDFINNTADKYGGGVNYRKTPYNITFNSNFINNSAKHGAGVNFFETFENVVFNGDFVGNNAIYGGGIYVKTGKIENTSFVDNSATYGGAIFFNGTGCVNNVEFIDNYAAEGGAIFTNGNLTVKNAAFKDNGADDGTNQISLNATVGTVALVDVTPKKIGPYKIANLRVVCINDEYIEAMVTWKGNSLNEGITSMVINNKTYVAKVKNGYAAINIKDLNPGLYTTDVCYDGGDYYNNPIQTITFDVLKHDSKIIAPNRIVDLKDAGDGFEYQFSLKDENGNPLANKEVAVLFNGKSQTVKTDENGLATVTLNANAEGLYDIKMTFFGDDEHYGVTQYAEIKIVYEPINPNDSITPDKSNREGISIESGKESLTSDKTEHVISLKSNTGNPVYGAEVILILLNFLLLVKGILFPIHRNEH
ncbi:hypothetical protein [Methanobrevibacter sp.]|uniref:hypothetical protein n=1 Tax=Methanobrevibacter sp. TaxID=66852 RepID=UPI00388E72FC